MKGNIYPWILSMAFIITGNFGTTNAWGSHQSCSSGTVLTDTYLHQEGFDFETMTKNGIDPANNDIHWESTGYQFGGHGSIYGMHSNHSGSFEHARIQLIAETDILHVTLDTCSQLFYGELELFSRISDTQIVCVSQDANDDGVFGDRFAAVQLNSHVDDVGLEFAASANLSVILLEPMDPSVCNDDNPCTVESCTEDGLCASEFDPVLCGEEFSPCAGPAPGSNWKNHGDYQKTLAHQTKIAVENGDITAEERDAILTAGANSDCGH